MRFAIRVHGRHWHVRFSTHGERLERPVCSSEATEAEAREKAEAFIADYQAGRGGLGQAPSRNPFVLHERRLASRGDSHRVNCERYRHRFSTFFKDADLRQIGRHDVERWRDWLLTLPATHKGTAIAGRLLSPKSVKEHIAYLSSIFRISGLPNPCTGVERPKKTERERQETQAYFTVGEMAALFAAAKGDPFEHGFRFLAFTGCRAGGLRNLRIEDFDVDARSVWINEKGQKRRRLILSGPCAPAWTALVAQLRAKPRDDEHVFPHGATWAHKGMTRLCARAKVPFRSPHSLRHTFVSHALFVWKPAWKIEQLSRWIGHADTTTTNRIYGHWIPIEPPSAWGAGTNLGQIEEKHTKHLGEKASLERETGFEPNSLLARIIETA